MAIDHQDPLDPLTVIVTGVGGGGVGRQVLKALLTSPSHPYRLIGTDTSRLSIGLYESHDTHILPAARSPQYLEEVESLSRREDVDFVIPGSEPELLALTSREKDLWWMEPLFKKTRVLANSRRVIDICTNKYELSNFLSKHGIPNPKYNTIHSDLDLNKINYYPVVVKPYLKHGGSRMVFLAEGERDVSFFSNYLRRYGYQPMAQEYIGCHDQEYTVGVLSVEGGEVLGSFALRRMLEPAISCRQRIHGHALSSGISQGEVREYLEVREQAEAISKKLGSEGPLNVQGRMVDGNFYPFEINPRFSGTTSIRALMGWNEPDILINHHLTGKRPKDGYRHGYVLRGLQEVFVP